MQRTRFRRSAFTLIELLLVLVILAVLAGIVIPKFTGRQKQAQETAVKTQLKSFETAIDAFEVDVGHYPKEDEGGLRALVTPPAGTNFKPMFKEVPKDPWGNPYQYRSPGQKNPETYDVFSLGADGQEGSDDLGNWSEGK